MSQRKRRPIERAAVRDQNDPPDLGRQKHDEFLKGADATPYVVGGGLFTRRRRPRTRVPMDGVCTPTIFIEPLT